MIDIPPIDARRIKTAPSGEAYKKGQTPDRVPVAPIFVIGYAAELFGVPRNEAYANPSLAVKLKLAASEFL